MRSTAKTIRDRFMEKFTPEPFSGCWLWIACGDSHGYGKITIEKESDRAHRVSYRLFRGDIPRGMFVCHHCDTPSCVNPEHLFLGTSADNTRDCVKKNRLARGEQRTSSVFTEESVRLVRRLYGTGDYSMMFLANIFRCSATTIEDIVTRQKWRHVV